MTDSSGGYQIFSEFQYLRIGQLVADRDAFLLLFEIVRSARPLTIAQLCGRFRASPALVNEVFMELSDLGLAHKDAGAYKATSFGESVVDFVEGIANRFRPVTEVPKAAAESVRIAQPSNLFITATNNTVRGTLSNTVSVLIHSPAMSKAAAGALTANDDNVEAVRSDQTEIYNASRSHNYL